MRKRERETQQPNAKERNVKKNQKEPVQQGSKIVKMPNQVNSLF